MRVLIADDDPTSRRMLEAILTKWGYDVTVACDGNEAWEHLQRPDAPGLVLLDWMMPGMEGVEICRKLRKEKRLRPAYIVIVTTRDSKQDLVQGLAAGANDYIGKPFDNEELRARIEVGQRVVELESALADRVEELQNALDHVKTLQGILPICVHCHKIRNDQESWERIEKYIMEHTDADFTHGLCPECARKHYPKYYPGDDAEDRPKNLSQ